MFPCTSLCSGPHCYEMNRRGFIDTAESFMDCPHFGRRSCPIVCIWEERMGTPQFTPEFKAEAVRQTTKRGYSVAEVSNRLSVSARSL